MSEGSWDTPETREQVRESIKRQIAEMKKEKEDVIAECDKAYIEKRSLPDLDGVPFVEYPDTIMGEIAAAKANQRTLGEIADREMAEANARWEERRQIPIRQAKDYLASCTDEKDLASDAYWRAERLKAQEEQLAKPLENLSPQEESNEWLDMERVNQVFPPMLIQPLDMTPGAINGWITLGNHRELLDEINSKMYDLRLENQFFKTTNRVLTILLVFSTAFGIAAALAWLRCQ